MSPYFKLITFCSLMTLSGIVSAEDYIEWVGANSGVNWSTGQITAEGAGLAPPNKPPSAARLLACRAAVVDGQRNLLESIQGVRVNSATVVSDLMLKKDIIKTSVEGLLKGAIIVKRTPKDDGSCLVEMVAPLNGQFATNIYADELETQISTIVWLQNIALAGVNFLVPAAYASEQVSTPSWQKAVDTLAQRLSALEELISANPKIMEKNDSKPTGLVLDARGSNFIPSMSPKIRKIRAGVLYPSKQHQVNSRDRGQLVSLFTRDIDTAKRHPIVGDRPVVIKALRTWGDTRTQIVLGKDSSARLAALVSDGFLEDAGVIIVL